uniref:Uncharacterized protein n=1 Tax=Tetranychus urticae TaxID=32264 RepID=T1JR03_TETUR
MDIHSHVHVLMPFFHQSVGLWHENFFADVKRDVEDISEESEMVLPFTPENVKNYDETKLKHWKQDSFQGNLLETDHYSEVSQVKSNHGYNTYDTVDNDGIIYTSSSKIHTQKEICDWERCKGTTKNNKISIRLQGILDTDKI